MKTISFSDWCDFLTNVVEVKNLHFNEDQVILVCGYEGSGKSTFTIASYCEVMRRRDMTPCKELIFYEWEEYLRTNLAAMIKRLDTLPPGMVQDLLLHYQITEKQLQMPPETYLPERGDILCYDEAGTQAFNRQAMSGSNINQAKLLIANRFLNLVHMWNVPKPGSVDRYIREERCKILVWVDSYYTPDWKQKIRNIYVYGKESYQRILASDKWWTLFSNTSRLIKRHRPDFRITLPTNLPDLIPNDINEYYETKKNVFNIRQVLDMIEDTKDNPEKTRINHLDRMVQEGEDLKTWMKRTGCTPSQFNTYGGSKMKLKREKNED